LPPIYLVEMTCSVPDLMPARQQTKVCASLDLPLAEVVHRKLNPCTVSMAPESRKLEAQTAEHASRSVVALRACATSGATR
jgi:hypothetical protein